jgi:hypothetical protein
MLVVFGFQVVRNPLMDLVEVFPRGLGVQYATPRVDLFVKLLDKDAVLMSTR